jgi:superfamily II DNA/RNA helicase
VVDEADLVMGYGFKDDLENVAKNIPKGIQVLYAYSLHIAFSAS